MYKDLQKADIYSPRQSPQTQQSYVPNRNPLEKHRQNRSSHRPVSPTKQPNTCQSPKNRRLLPPAALQAFLKLQACKGFSQLYQLSKAGTRARNYLRSRWQPARQLQRLKRVKTGEKTAMEENSLGKKVDSIDKTHVFSWNKGFWVCFLGFHLDLSLEFKPILRFVMFSVDCFLFFFTWKPQKSSHLMMTINMGVTWVALARLSKHFSRDFR